MPVLKALAILKASGSEGAYLPASMALRMMVADLVR